MAKRLHASYFHAYFAAAARRLPKRFAVVTAFNPMGRRVPAAENRLRDAALRKRLKARAIECFRVTGGSKDGSHREPGWGAVVPSPETARALAAEFDQNAYYWISSGRIFLGSAAGGALKRAGSWSARRARWD